MQFATVSDDHDAPGDLRALLTGLPAGVSVGSITNAGGIISATLLTSCGVTLGSSSFNLEVNDSAGATSTSTLSLSITPHQPPNLGTFSDTTATSGSTFVVTPATPLTSDGSMTVQATASGGFTGTLTVTSDGQVSVTNPNSGTFTIQVTATDSCGTATSHSFVLHSVPASAVPVRSGACA